MFAPLGIHAAAGAAKRLLRPRRASLRALTAYPLLLALPVHVLTHRLLPCDPAPPVRALGPAELDYELVKAALARWPVRSWALYGALVACVLVHACEGWALVARTWGGGRGGGRRTRRAAAGAAVGVVLSGLLVVAREPLLALESTLVRIHASYSGSIVYRI